MTSRIRLLSEDYGNRISNLKIDDPQIKFNDESIIENDLFKIPILTWKEIISFLHKKDFVNVGEVDPLDHLGPQERRKGTNYSLHRIHSVCLYKQNDLIIVLFKVLHSMSLNETPVKAWFVINNQGKILEGFCSCLCGHTGRCSHSVGCLMFLETHHSTRKTCTDTSCYWVGSSNVGNLNPTPIQDISYKTVDIPMTNGHSSEIRAHFNQKISSPSPTLEEKKTLVSKLKSAYSKGVLFRHSEEVRMPLSDHTISNDPPKFSGNSIFHFINKVKSFTDNKKVQEEIIIKEFHTFNELKGKAFENSSRFSWDSHHRYLISGRNCKDISSKMESRKKSYIDLANAISLIENSGLNNVTSEAIKYGIESEPKALNLFMSQIGHLMGFEKSLESGIHLDIRYPYIGSTPDLILLSDSGEKIPVEVKSSFKYKGEDYKESNTLSKLDFLKCNIHPKRGEECYCNEDNFEIRKTHSYYYQVMLELGTLGSSYGFFVVYFGDDKPLFVKKIHFDPSFYKKMVKNYELFYFKFFLPKILDNVDICSMCDNNLNPLPLFEFDKSENCSSCDKKYHNSCLNQDNICQKCYYLPM